MALEEVTSKPKSKPVSETRKIRKPLMERKRRERINTSLNELARLLTEAQKVKTDKRKSTKLEKADILELTVKHLQELGNNREKTSSNQCTNNDERYQEGFKECIRVVEKAMKKSTAEELRERLLTHLHARLKVLKGIHKRTEEKQDEKENRLLGSQDSIVTNKETKPDSEGKYALTLVPTKLPDGEVAFVLTGSAQKLLKEWKNLSESRIDAMTENVSLQNTLNSTIENRVEAIQYEQDIKPDSNQNNYSISNVTFMSPSTSHSDMECEPKIYHTLQPLSPQLYYSSSHNSPSTSKLQGKSHCPPTPPPSPTNDGQKASTIVNQFQPVVANRPMMEQHDMNQPFDLSMSRMWRPW